MAISKFRLDSFGGRKLSGSGAIALQYFRSLKKGTRKVNFLSNELLKISL